MKKAIFFILFMPFFKLSAQYDILEIKSMVQNNIMLFHISNILEKQIETDKLGNLKNKTFSGDWINLLMEGQKMDLNISVRKIDSIQFYNNQYCLYEIKVNNLHFIDRDKSKSLLLTLPSYYFNQNSRYLIGTHKSKKEILFISGQFYKNEIGEYFNKITTTQILIDFLKLKLFSIGASEFKVIKETKRKWYVSYCDEKSELKKITVLKTNPDKIIFD